MRTRRTTLAIGLWLWAVGSWAQTTLIDTLREVTVTETRHSHALKSTAPMHVLDRHDMLVQGVTDIADALHRLPGITLRDYGGAGGMKTVSVRGFGAKHTGVSYDGVMLSECQSGEIDLSRYSLDNVDHLSLVVGDNSDIFIPARNATTPATLTIQTLRQPSSDHRPQLTAQLKAGSFGYTSPFLRYEQCLSDKLSFSAVGEYVYAENDYPYTIKNGIETIHDRRNNSRMNSGHAELNMLWTTGGASQLGGKLYYYDNDRQLPGVVHYYVNLNKETLRDRNVFGQLTYQTRWGHQLSLKWHGKFNWFSSIYRDGLYQGSINDASYWQREAYTSAALLYTPNHRWAFDYSADYAFNNLNGSSKRTVVGQPYRHTILQSATAKYRDNRLTMIGRLLHSLYLNDSKEGPKGRDMRRLSPSLSVAYKLFEEHEVYLRASYKNIFRVPTFNENYYYHYGSTNLKPESTDQYNLGITCTNNLTERTTLQLSLDGYYNQVADKIVTLPVNMFMWRCVNVGKVQIVGADATLRAVRRFSSEQTLSMAGSYSFQSAKDKTLPGSSSYDKQLAYTPLHTVSGSVGYENPWVNLSLHLTGMSDRWANNAHYEDTDINGYVEFGLTAWRHFRFGRHQLEGRLDLKNLLNTQYELVRYYPMPRRSYQVTFNYKF